MFVIYIFSTLILVFYLWLKLQWTYWTKKGVYQVEPLFPFGNQYGFITKTKHLNEHLQEDAEETKNLKYYGGYFFKNPTLFINDADLVRQVLVKDFDYFLDRMGPDFTRPLQTGHYVDVLWAKQMPMACGGNKNILHLEVLQN